MPDDNQSALFIDGERYTMADLTFREQRKMREYIQQLAPDHDADSAAEADIIPALITVVKQRTDSSFELDQALDFKPSDLEAPPTPAEGE